MCRSGREGPPRSPALIALVSFFHVRKAGDDPGGTGALAAHDDQTRAVRDVAFISVSRVLVDGSVTALVIDGRIAGPAVRQIHLAEALAERGLWDIPLEGAQGIFRWAIRGWQSGLHPLWLAH